MMGGTRAVKVIFSFCTVSQNWTRSKRGITWRGIPKYKTAWIKRVRPKMWKNGNTPRATSLLALTNAWSKAWYCNTLDVILECLNKLLVLVFDMRQWNLSIYVVITPLLLPTKMTRHVSMFVDLYHGWLSHTSSTGRETKVGDRVFGLLCCEFSRSSTTLVIEYLGIR